MTSAPAPRRLRRAFVGGLAALLVAACATVEETPRLGAAAGATPGDVVTIAIPPPASVDPGDAHEPVGTMIAGALCDSLLGIDPETGELVPALATSWTVTDDGRRIMLRLREGVYFPDGNELTAADVVHSLSRAASAAFAGQAADLLAPVHGFRAIRGQDPDAPQHQRERLSGVQQLTKYTVQISLRDPGDVGSAATVTAGAEFVHVLTHPVAAPISQAATEADPRGVSRQPVCVGPYHLADPWEPGDRHLRLVRNDDYYGLHGGFTSGGRGYVDEIVLRVVPALAPQTRPPDDDADLDEEAPDRPGDEALGEAAEPTAPRVAAPRLDGYDLVLLPAGLVDALDPSDELTIATAPAPGVEYVGVPVDGPRLTTQDGGSAAPALTDGTSGRELRIALSQALDRRRIADDVFAGTRGPALGFLPSTLGTRAHRTTACGPHVPETGDVDAARDRLAAAGLSLRGHVLELPFNDDHRNRRLVEEVARQWEDAFGLTVRPRPLPWAEYLREMTGIGGAASAFRVSWSVPYPDADRWLYPLFHTSGIGQANWSGFSDPWFDETIVEEARRAVDPEDRMLVYHELEDRLCEEMPLIPVVEQRTVVGLRGDRVASATGSIAGGPRGEILLRELYVPAD